MKFTPLHDRVLVRRVEEDDKTGRTAYNMELYLVHLVILYLYFRWLQFYLRHHNPSPVGLHNDSLLYSPDKCHRQFCYYLFL